VIMALSFRQLRYFLVLSEELHFGRAAERLHISQPPLSASIRQVEEELGVKLLARDQRGTRLTPAGAVFAQKTASILGQLESAKITVSCIAEGSAGDLKIGFVPSMVFRHIDKLVRTFEDEFPKVNISLAEVNSLRQLNDLSKHEIDIGFIHALPLPPEIDCVTLERERFMCCLPRGHRLATRSRISLPELEGEKILIISRRDSPYYHDQIAAFMRSSNLQPHTNYKLQNWFTMFTLIGQGMGVSIVPQSLYRSRLQEHDVKFVELSEENAEHELQLIWRREDIESTNNTVSAFVSHTKRYYIYFSRRPASHIDYPDAATSKISPGLA